MNSAEIPFLSATETARAVKANELSPVDAVRAYLERIDRLDSRLAAYITVIREEALGAAQQIHDRQRCHKHAGDADKKIDHCLGV